MRILALNAFHGGSHKTVLEGWQQASRHEIAIRSCPGHHWKWRMRHAAWTLALACNDLQEVPDLIWCTDMLDLASWRGLVHPSLRDIPAVCYFHENQLTYPDERRSERDLHYAFTNLLAGASAEAVWWNSSWHRDDFLGQAADWLRRLPDQAPTDALDKVRQRSHIVPPGVDLPAPRPVPSSGPTRILWAARWEADKGPARLVQAIDHLATHDLPFELSIIGGHADQAGAELQDLHHRHQDRIRHWGWLPDQASYHQALHEADIVVSTAHHEFFGISVVEAVAGGAWPLVPDALAYPEVLADFTVAGDNGRYAANALNARLVQVVARHRQGALWGADPGHGRSAVAHHDWSRRVDLWDRLAAKTADSR